MVDTESCDERLTKAIEFVVSQCHASAAIRMPMFVLIVSVVYPHCFLNM